MNNVIAFPTAPHSPARIHIPPPQTPLACWREDPLGAIALFVTGFLLIAATGIATFL